ncbi:histidinol-phosphate aminotransferase family protein [Sphingomonas sp. MG17]|uniref:Histidinol-phosphate aminotransferase family protein n=1 Tax=Sphingomonas tagetis TaxID=2949092 RepID=A0A9X2HPV8_9SPHN|nr:histidinol-phosphate transaminase [Sphingomonas tagetis]MCP3730355.1 histidinol-phosphate aminotransferase family protein [Sphingomonas tagetis]
MTQPILSRREWLALSAATTALATAPGAVGQTAAARARLSLNENAWGPSARVAPAIARAASGIERYVDQSEVDALTRQIAAIERVDPAQVVLGEVLEPLGLFLARQRPGGGEIVYSAPGYTALIDSAAPLGGRGVPVPLDANLENDLPALTRAITDRTLAVSLVNPHNPSGTANETQALHRFIEAAAQRTLVVVDEAYLEYDAFAEKTAIPHVRAGRNVLVFRTLAKIYGLAGLSIGYAVAPRALAEGLRAAGIGSPHSLSRLALAAASKALADQAHVRTVRRATLAERDKLNRLIDQRGWPRTDSRANFVFFKPPQAAQLRDRLRADGIDIARPFPPLTDWLRITIGRPQENARVLAILRRWR